MEFIFVVSALIVIVLLLSCVCYFLFGRAHLNAKIGTHGRYRD